MKLQSGKQLKVEELNSEKGLKFYFLFCLENEPIKIKQSVFVI